MGQQVRVEVLAELDPSRAAGSDHGKRAPLLDPLQEFVAFLDDRQVGAELGVEDPVKTEPTQGGDHPARHPGPGRIPETLAQGGPDGRGGLYDHVQGRVVQGRPDGVDVVLFADGPHRTDGRALAALNAGDRVQAAVEGRADDGLETAPLRVQGSYPLDLGADGHAPAAVDALGTVPVQRRGPVIRNFAALLPGVGNFPHSQRAADHLQFAILVPLAGLAFAIVVGKDQVQDGPAAFAHPPGIGQHVHPFVYRGDAGSDQVPVTLDLHHTDPTGPDGLNILQVAEGRDLDAGLLGGRQDGRPFRHLDVFSVNQEFGHVISLAIISCSDNRTAGSAWLHAPRSVCSRAVPLR
ncbi:MAG: hypothetical protein BWY73_00093 [candidate division TA06 bacterium ADurb.Bin417]|uniref:Uncharacterized protein n=1 Tax=candidate division TA06 bacterium ADurb.Bin417 TaxID=1852828 RepID=A0A1V5ML62_UNCT6|nr:MAG: hypothetical protein BWY73_00093 [candidate division TA06 bacterium ADurb.Bin417]